MSLGRPKNPYFATYLLLSPPTSHYSVWSVPSYHLIPLVMTDSVLHFHYADFATFTETSLRGKSRTQIMKVRDTNHVTDLHDLCRKLS